MRSFYYLLLTSSTFIFTGSSLSASANASGKASGSLKVLSADRKELSHTIGFINGFCCGAPLPLLGAIYAHKCKQNAIKQSGLRNKRSREILKNNNMFYDGMILGSITSFSSLIVGSSLYAPVSLNKDTIYKHG